MYFQSKKTNSSWGQCEEWWQALLEDPVAMGQTYKLLSCKRQDPELLG